ncbi:MAG: DUF2860 family protein [Vibrionaceae bacterium]
MKFSFNALLCLPFIFTLAAKASSANAEPKSAITGEIAVLALHITTNSNLSSIDDTTQLSTLNSEGKQEHQTILGGLGKLAFNFGDQRAHQIFLGTTREDIAVGSLAFEVGYRLTLDSKTQISFSYLPTLLKANVWSDPFVTGAPRTKTKQDGEAYRIQLKNIANTPLSFDVAYASSDIEHEQSGAFLALNETQKWQLARSYDAFYARVSFQQFLGKGLGVTPSLFYTNSNAKGDALAFDEVGAKLTYFNFAGRHRFFITGAYSEQNYKGSHPIFSKTREDQRSSLFLTYEFAELFGHPSLSLISLNGLFVTHSNLEFYDEKQYMTSLGVNLRF